MRQSHFYRFIGQSKKSFACPVGPAYPLPLFFHVATRVHAFCRAPCRFLFLYKFLPIFNKKLPAPAALRGPF